MNKTRDYDDPEIQRHILIEYLMVMAAMEDWHGVADAAMDLRELDVHLRHQEK